MRLLGGALLALGVLGLAPGLFPDITDRSLASAPAIVDVFAARWPQGNIAVGPAAGDRAQALTRLAAALGSRPENTARESLDKLIAPQPELSGGLIQAGLASNSYMHGTGSPQDSGAGTNQSGRDRKASRNRPLPPAKPTVTTAKTELIEFASAPFPYDGPAARTPSGRLLRGAQNYSDNRVLLHIPTGFNVEQPAVMVVFLHGHRARLERDVIERQQVPAQISTSGVNAVLAAPQFAVDAADSNPGRFAEPGGFARFIAEAGRKFARLYGNARKARQFQTMPVVVVAYSGGYVPAASIIQNGSLGKRLQGVVLLDALYGELDIFADWIERSPSSFFVSAYTSSTKRHNLELARILDERNLRYSTKLDSHLWSGRVAILAADDAGHSDFVTRAWTNNPIRDLLTKLN